ncbi:hypothetical protein L3Q82_005391 [Scortum barcoo]|uniref:Uncharacterized protein n=1 Tax=Scortum barcoo TaxID=214431 RepID=A0ACB8V9T3_9TELE|nr:hypothetical protein L3Q82_005391 [Scortum barcoo]
MEHSIYEDSAGARGSVEKEPLAIVEQFKDRLEEIQRDGKNDRQEVKRDEEKWGLVHEIKTVEIKYPPVEEPMLQEICIERMSSSRSVTEVRDMTGMVSHLSMDMDHYLEQRPVVTFSSQEDLVQDRFDQVIVKRDGKRRPPDIKKPIRKKLRDRERSGCSSSEGELERMSSEESLDGDAVLKEGALVCTTLMDPPASPLVVETPIGSIKDKVKALQNKVEEEKEQKNTQDLMLQEKYCVATKKTEGGMPELPRVPKSPKSPRSQTERLEETMSVKELLTAFQTGQDPSKNKAGLFEHKTIASSTISTLMSDPADSDEIKGTEHSPMQELKSQTQTQSPTIFPQPSDVKKCDKTERSTRSISESEDFDEIQTTQQIPMQELKSQTQTQGTTVSHQQIDIKKCYKTEDPQDKTVASSCISTSISESADSDDIQRTEHSPMGNPQTETQSLTVFHPQSNVNIHGTLDLEAQTVSLRRDNSEESQIISDNAYFGETVKISDTTPFDDASGSDQREESELSEKTLGMMQLEEPVISTGRSLSQDIQISPDRRPSEDFSADIKAELEESPEYQLFKQTSTVTNASYGLEAPEEEILADDSDINQVSISSPCMKSYFGDDISLTESQMRDDDSSPESPKHEGMAESSNTSAYVGTHNSSSGESENYEGLAVTHEVTIDMFTVTTRRAEEKLHKASKENTTTDCGSKIFFTQADSEVTQLKIEEPQFQEVHIERKTSTQESTSVKDMSGMFTLMRSDLDQYLQARPVVCRPPEEDIVQEKFEQIIVTKDKDKETLGFVTDENKGTNVGGTTQETDHGPKKEHSITWGDEESESEFKEVKDLSGMLSGMNTDLNQHLEATPLASQSIEEDNVQEKLEKSTSFTDENERVIADGVSQEIDCVRMKHKVTRRGEDMVMEFKETQATLTDELPMKEEWIEKKTSYQPSTKVKDMSESFSSEEAEAKTSSSAVAHFDDCTEGMVDTAQSYGTIDDCAAAHSIVNMHTFVQLPSKSNTPPRPADLENLNTVVFDDQAKEPCHRDSLEASPLMEDTSSKTSPDSIEPSPTRESPCPDSLEGSPIQPKDIDLEMSAKTAVYEDYASQLEACLTYDICREESEHDEQENSYEISHMESEIKEDKYPCSPNSATNGNMCSDPKISDSENIHMIIRQDSLNTDDSEDDTTNKQFTPEEEMFKMAAKIKTFEEMEQEAKMKKDKSLDATVLSDKHHPDDDKQGYEGENGIVFNAQVKPEEQINLCPAEERKTPDKTPIRTPGDERTPEPFQFQEGKLFEMTRGGAIDMTRRSFDEGGEEYAFFHIGEHPVDEVVPEETVEDQTKPLTLENSDSLQEIPKSSLTHDTNEKIPTPKPRTHFQPLSDKSEKHRLSETNLGSSKEVELDSPSAYEKLTIIQSQVGGLECLGLDYLDSTIADLQSDTSTIVHSMSSQQRHDSSDSSLDEDDEEEEDEEDQCSVIEMSCLDAQAGVPGYHQDSSPSLAIKPGSEIEEDVTAKDSQISEPERCHKNAEKSKTLDRRTRSEADSDKKKVSNKDIRSYSDSSQPTNKSNLSRSRLPVMMQHKPLIQTISSSSPQRKEIKLSKNMETSVNSSLDTDDTSSACHRSPDSVVFTYDIPASHSSDSDGNPLPGVQPSSGTEDVFVSRPSLDDTVETQMQRIIDDQTPESMPEDCLIKRLTKINRMDIVHLIETQMNNELNPNLWTSEDVITQEPTSYENLDEQVSTASSKINLSESSKHKNVHLGQSQFCPTKTTFLAHDSYTLAPKRLGPIPSIPGDFDLSKTQSEIMLTSESSSPQENAGNLSLPKQSENCDLAKPSSVTLDPLCQTVQNSANDKIIMPPESPSTPSGSGSPELDQLLSELKEMKLKFRPETDDPPLSESSDEGPENKNIYKFEDLSPEDGCLYKTVTSARHFSFEELMPYPSLGISETSSDEDRPRTSGQYSEESLTPVEYECFTSQPTSVKPKAEMTSSTSDEEYSIPPGYTETSSTATIYTHMPPEYAKVVQSGTDSPTFEYSDQEPYFDCKQAASDFSETEPDEPEASTRAGGDHPQDHLNNPRVLEKMNQRVLLSSGSEDYEDAFFVHEPLYNLREENEELLHYSETSDEEFTLCEASQLPPVCETGAYDDTDKSLIREITAELGSMSESSDDEFLTTRIVQRRVVIQAEEMPDLPTQSVTEEKYKDENGHIVVKRVTRKIIRKCVSMDGVEHEEVSLEGAPQGSISMAAGDGYSKVVKRTVLKSEGDHTEVTFTECEGFSASRQETDEGCKVSCTEKTMVVEGKRTVTHQGDTSLASDLPSAQDDFKQALGYISGFRRTALPHVVETEIVKDDGTVVRRAHMRKDRTLRRTVVKGAGQRKQVLLEQVDNPRKGSKPRNLQQHLHQLFHRYYEDEEDNDEEEEEEEG